jgi:hypothetical protein
MAAIVSWDPAPVMHRALALLCLGCGPTSAFASSHAQACINVLWNAWLSVDIRVVLGGLLEERANVPAARGERLQHEHRQRGHRHGAQFVSGVAQSCMATRMHSGAERNAPAGHGFCLAPATLSHGPAAPELARRELVGFTDRRNITASSPSLAGGAAA